MTIGRESLTRLLDERDSEIARLKAALAQAEQALRAVTGRLLAIANSPAAMGCDDIDLMHEAMEIAQAALRAITGEE